MGDDTQNIGAPPTAEDWSRLRLSFDFLPVKMEAVSSAHSADQHAETIVQSRLSNFLLAISVLFLAWTSAFSAADELWRGPVLTVLSLLMTCLSVLWTIMGGRQRKFISLHYDVMFSLEEKLPLDDLKIGTTVADLGSGARIAYASKALAHAKNRSPYVHLTMLERLINPANALTIVPAVFSLSSAVLAVISVVSGF
jgi:hypothetical protein